MDLKHHAKSLSKDLRRQIIMDYRETDLHYFLKRLFLSMEPDYMVEITHGPYELGKDLVIVKSDKFTQEVIGVIVKCGNIRGTTVGDVDGLKERVDEVIPKSTERKLREIDSQIQQTIAHPAEMKLILESLPISKVFVVLAGEFSKQARSRLTKELTTEIKIFDINWLIDNFTEFYPQIFFEGRVIDFLERKTQELEINHRLINSGKNLSEYFVNPLIRPFSNPLRLNKNRIVLRKRKKLPFSELVELCKKVKKLVLLGDPGTGKTGAMAKLTIEMYQKAHSQLLMKSEGFEGKISVPVFVSARSLLESESTESFLTEYFKSKETKDRFKIDVLMIDGLDEIESTNQRSVIDKLDELSEELSCSYILASRQIDIINTLPEKYKKYELKPFEFKQAFQLFSNLISDSKILDTMKETLEKIQAQILLVPLSLMLLIELIEEHKEIPASVTELYDRFFDLLLGRWDKEKGVEVLFEYHIKKSFLGALAYSEFRVKNRLEISSEDFERFLDFYAERYGFTTRDLKNFVQEIKRAGILDQREVVTFKHRAFLDYFAAFYLYENRGELDNLNDLIVNTYFDSRWSEVAFFYIGLLRQIGQDLLESIYSYENNMPIGDSFKLLSGRLLQAGWHSPIQQRTYGIQRAISYAPRVRERITSLDPNIPSIAGDFIVFALTDLSFNSGFLEQQIKNYLGQLTNSKSNDDIYMAVALLWSIRRFLKPDEMRQNMDAILDGLASFSDAEQARILLLMTIIEDDKEMRKVINRQLEKIKKRSPRVFRALLPPK